MWLGATQRSPLLPLAGALISFQALAQVNAFVEVTTIAGNTLSLSGAVEVYDSFEDGEQAILMQMQDDVAGANLSNTPSFGDLSSIASAGYWEVVTIASHSEALGLPTSVVVAAPLTHVFHFGAKHRVQLISYPELGTPDFATITPITAVPWNGVVGGVVAFQVSGILDLAHDINGDYSGFRSGVPSANFNGACAPTVYATSSANYAEKGEGVQRVSSVNHRYARSEFVNGAGGGNPKNSGGGGGGHWTSGGNGGGGYGCSPGAGGFGGNGLASYVYWDRIFMGGGGGGGQQNNGLGGAGGSGGGIVIMHAGMLRTIGPCPTLYISANGANGGSSIGLVPDGAGGGGAGGTVWINVNTWAIDPTCSVVCEANGGNGGLVICTGPPSPAPGNWIDSGGGGGGGAQGAVMCSSGATAGVAAGTAPGSGGAHDPAGGRAMDGPGPANAGVQGFGAPISLPIELLSFTGTARAHDVVIEWTTASEQNNDHFEVERSDDLHEWKLITTLAGTGNSTLPQDYRAMDPTPLYGTGYYRLIQVDIDATRSIFGPVAVEKTTQGVMIAPQPADADLWIIGEGLEGTTYRLLAADGRLARTGTIGTSGTVLSIDELAPGTYFMHIANNDHPLFNGPVIIAR